MKEYKSSIEIGESARKASKLLAIASSEQKNLALLKMSEHIGFSANKILEENKKDLKQAEEKNISPAFLDRLMLNKDRLDDIRKSLEEIASFEDPVGKIQSSWERPNGLKISRVSTPLGVIGVIFESRPNVTADAGALCLKSGNASILRGGSDSIHSSLAIGECLEKGLYDAKLPTSAIQVINSTDREIVKHMLNGMNKNIDVIVPRGGKSLVAEVEKEAKVPVFGHLEGICHIYIDKFAKKYKAIEIIHNAKLRRPGICGAVETVLIHHETVDKILPELIDNLMQNNCEVRGCETVQNINPNVIPATEKDWTTEYLLPIISIKVVKSLNEAILHIEEFSSGHTESIITENDERAEIFQKHIDSAIVMHNASTQFADGGEFGLGGEIGIATGKFHARGPVGVEQLTSFKYLVKGTNHLRD